MFFRYITLILMTSGMLGGCAGGTKMSKTDPAESVHKIFTSSDSIILSDYFVARGDYIAAAGGPRLQVSCEGKTCTMTIPASPGPLKELTDVWSMPMSAQRFHDEGWHADTGEFNTIINGVSVDIFCGNCFDESGIDTFITYGGWMKYSFFGTNLVSNYQSNQFVPKWGYAFSTGVESVGNPAGSATWKGAMIGNVTSQHNQFHRIQGEATLSFWLPDNTLNVVFTNIRDVDSELSPGTPHSHSDMSWTNLDVQDGSFQNGSDGNSIQGQFYGPDHQEVGGIFEKINILGAFGARRIE